MIKILPYGTKQIDLDIEGAELLDVEEVDSGRTATIDNMAVIRDALRKPLSTKRLREIVATKNPESIIIVVDDHTRDTPTEKMLDALTEEIGESHEDNLSLIHI